MKNNNYRVFTWTIISLMIAASISCIRTKDDFTAEEISIIHSGDSTQMLRVLQTTIYEDSLVLRKPSARVNPGKNDESLNLLIARMFLAMRDTLRPGVGIAAPQVGINRKVIWLQRLDKEGSPFEVYLNPKILQYSKLTRKGFEGCLSIPDCREEVCRSYTIMVSYSTINGMRKTEMIEGFTAVIFQHEVDHLKGILFTDRLTDNPPVKLPAESVKVCE